jgi:hypothetical protein
MDYNRRWNLPLWSCRKTLCHANIHVRLGRYASHSRGGFRPAVRGCFSGQRERQCRHRFVAMHLVPFVHERMLEARPKKNN